ncbi:putative F-box protein At3g29830 [Brachypodium distachyon]|uniref:Uncharacterized protein n=1 Tax=Brachypodium distachyon TaxID=15368 RepID=A0A0Q3FZL6_BRADI|nr:putative F-box protein At3g29830 [Brachypodium distachyon]KQK03805.1 hypothetical protein BRADI_2g09920v3 [Brachypodium distachyon]|eukprot:XP_014754289.1 putative F-box protein At3g29830 [Brachypodium distachyon]
MAAGAAEEPQDRLSGLPDDVLHSIIGRVPFKQAVRTNALSRRWPRLWLHALAASGVLDFTDRGFVRSKSRGQIVAMVNRCLRVRGGGAPIDVLRVSLCPFGAFERDVVGWIAAAIRRGAREVDVNLTLDAALTVVNCRADQLELPGDLFYGESSLARLSLGRCSLRNVPAGGPALVGLTSLSLTRVDITDDAVRDTVACCRLLEFLSLRNCHVLKFVRIAGEKLRGLEVVGCLDVRQLQVAAPALESFAFHGDILCFGEDDGFEFEPVEFIGKGNTRTPSEATPELRDAYLSHIGFGEYDELIHQYAYSTLMQMVAHAKILTICSVGLLHIEEERGFIEHMMDPPNLQLQELQLLMDSMGDDVVTGFSSFFQLTAPPLLERLFIRFPAACNDTEESSGGMMSIGEDEDIVLDFEIALDHLTFFKMVNFRGMRHEMRLLRFVLRRAPVLEQLVLVVPKEEGRTNLGLGHDDQKQLLKIVQENVSEIGKAFLWREPHVVVCRPREDCSRSPAHTKYYHDD